ncbi:negative elongation factor A [Octopus sinensis]|uniref:Negative elongation factor A n=1 Tax=Octopus sinensis TaxID=2607531 RepID=A0A6P7TEJ8_9MOLL|nr:negative elongation factor A [Octopus sinensis]
MASGDTALWLHNKLGSTDDLWSGKTICSQLSRDKLLSIQGCFYTLQPHVKVKVMLSFLHLPRRNVEEWQKEMEEILTIASGDSDHWVSTVAEILQTFPETGALKLDLENNSAFAEILADLKKVVRKNVDNRMLPIECQFLNKTALLSVAGQLPQPVKHFALKRKPKSATLRAELLQKSTEVANNRKNNVNNTVPVKVRNFSKKLDDPTFAKTTPTNNRSPSSANPLTVAGTPGTPSTPTSTTASTSNCFLSASTGLSRSSSLTPRATASTGSLRGKEGGIKLIEIAEQPVGAKEAKRRKKIADQEAIGQQKKEKETATAATSTVETTTSYTPDYAVGLVTPALAVSFVLTNIIDGSCIANAKKKNYSICFYEEILLL